MPSFPSGCVLAAATLLGLTGCVSDPARDPGLSAQALLGEKLFKDTSLSASGQQSCATCHDPDTAFGAPNALPAQPGGPAMDQQGNRLSDSIRYLSYNTAFFFSKDGTPTGGFFWDGRADSLAAQAAGPPLNPKEMANPDQAAVLAKLRNTAYSAEFRAVYGQDILDDAGRAYQAMTLAIQQYQRENPAFHPFDSKYDAFLQGRARLSAQELRGLALFNAPDKGNCAACHPSGRNPDGSPPLFTDFTYDVLGVPRNPALRVNADLAYYDLGLAARPAGDLAGRQDLYGAFKVPSLRNVAVRKAFFHNGRYTQLKDVLTFYVQRDTNPEKFYPLNPDGSVNKFDDLPAQYRGNVNVSEVPYNRKPGEAPALAEDEIDAVLAFLATLTDGYRP